MLQRLRELVSNGSEEPPPMPWISNVQSDDTGVEQLTLPISSNDHTAAAVPLDETLALDNELSTTLSDEHTIIRTPNQSRRQKHDATIGKFIKSQDEENGGGHDVSRRRSRRNVEAAY